MPLVPLLPYLEATRQLPNPLILARRSPPRASSCPTCSFAPRSNAAARRSSSTSRTRSRSSPSHSAPASRCAARSSSQARDCAGPLGQELQRALSDSRRDRDLNERDALVQVAHQTGEPTFSRFAELLAAKESPYLDFLRQQAAQARAEQSRYLERAADRAYLSMHAPIVAAARRARAAARLRLPPLPRPHHLTPERSDTPCSDRSGTGSSQPPAPREERGDSMINWLVLAVGLAVAAAAVVALLRPAITAPPNRSSTSSPAPAANPH